MTVFRLDDKWTRLVDELAPAILRGRDRKGAALAEEVASQSHAYTVDRDELASKGRVSSHPAARLRYFFLRDLLKPGLPLAELRAAGALPAQARWRVLDIGAGLGASSVGIAKFAAENQAAEALDITAVDVDGEALATFSDLLPRVSALTVPMTLSAVTGSFERLSSIRNRGPFDIIVCGFVWNELLHGKPPEEALAKWSTWIEEARSLLSEDGVILLLEPATIDSARLMEQLRDMLTTEPTGPHVFAPCVRSGPCPALQRERDWCHQRIEVDLPVTMRETARAAGIRWESLLFSYLTLTRKPYARVASTDPASMLLRIVSDPLPSKGRLEYWGCGDVGWVRLARLNRNHTKANEAYEKLARGDVVRLDGANQRREDAYDVLATTTVQGDDRGNKEIRK